MSIYSKIFNLLKYLKELFGRHFSGIKVMGTERTFNFIINNHVSVTRFGDGEFNLVFNNNIIFQKYDVSLSEGLKNVLINKQNVDNCLICIPRAMYRVTGYTNKSNRFWLDYSISYRKKVEGYLNKKYIYGDSQISRIFINRRNKKKSKKYFNLWKQVWNDKRVLLIEGEKTRFGVGNDLLSNSKSIKRILCPANDAFSKYSIIVEEVLKRSGEYDVVLIALGPTATVLAYELSQNNIWAIDIGHLDAEYEWSSSNNKTQVAIKGKSISEAKDGQNVGDCFDEKYLSEIDIRIV